MRITLTRRKFIKWSAAGALAMPGLSRAADRPLLSHGVQSGDIEATTGVVWARSDRPARLHIEVATTESFKDARRLAPIETLSATDFAVKRLLSGLPPGQTIFYRMAFADLAQANVMSANIVGRFRTAPASRRAVRFVWSGDTAGQGWGFNPDDGGMKTYATMARHDPDFFIHSGDKNIVAEGVEKVAETLDEFRGRWKYNLHDENLRAFNAAVPTFCQWDDHDVMDNWSASKDLSRDERYKEKSIAVLAARANRAFHEMMPIRAIAEEPSRIYRKISHGPLLDVFFLDLRSYRGPNGPSLETRITPKSRILGEAQMRWLKQALSDSKATWKVIASDMPIGVIVWDDWKARKG
ncbi:MAG: alkaline phosphatase, partial [Alphaproteobacteria bacterium]